MADTTTPAAPAATPPASTEPSLIPKDPATPKEPALIDTSVKPEVKDEYDYDKRLFTDDGKFNKDGYKEFSKEKKEKEEMYEKRILDLRRKVSDGKAPEKLDEYFLDYAPPDKKFEKYFDFPNMPEQDVKDIKQITGLLAQHYHGAALTKRQAEDMTKMVLHVLDSTGVIDTRTKDEIHIQKGRWIEDQKKMLGSNAENIIREAKLFVETTGVFNAKTKNMLLQLMEEQGADAIDAIYQIKEAYSGAGGMPTTVSGLAGLPSDAQLKQEYLDVKTTNMRRQEIIAMRAKSGRPGKLMDASY